MNRRPRILICLMALCAMLLTMGCGKEKPSFTLEGHVGSLLDGDTLLIFGGDELYPRLDTLVARRGAFSFAFSPDTVMPLWVLFPNGYAELFYAEPNTATTMTGAIACDDSLTVQGGHQNDLLTAFRQQTDSLTPPQRREKARTYIREHPFDEMSIALFRRYFVLGSPEVDNAQLRTIIDGMSGSLQDNNYIALLRPLVASNKPSLSTITNYSIRDTAGVVINTATYRDTCVLFSFWASWHPESRQHQRELRTLQETFAERPFAIISVSLDVDSTRWLNAMRDDSLTARQCNSFEGWDLHLLQQLGITRLPANVLMGASRRIKGTDLWGDALNTRVEQAVKEQEDRTREEERRKKEQELKNKNKKKTKKK